VLVHSPLPLSIDPVRAWCGYHSGAPLGAAPGSHVSGSLWGAITWRPALLLTSLPGPPFLSVPPCHPARCSSQYRTHGIQSGPPFHRTPCGGDADSCPAGRSPAGLQHRQLPARPWKQAGRPVRGGRVDVLSGSRPTAAARRTAPLARSHAVESPMRAR